MNDLLVLESLGQSLIALSKDNPLVCAAILERASIDGDVPEFRYPSDLLPVEGFRPAVPVVTDSINPIQVGMMLERASLEIQERFRVAHQDFYAMVLVGQDSTLPVSVAGYVAGNLPDLMPVPEPSVAVLAECPDDKARYFAWLSVATTQGRRSLAPAIERELERRVGFPAGTVLDPDVELDARWVMAAYGPEDLSDSFNPVESAIAFFVFTLRLRADFFAPRSLAFAVKPVADIAGRRFGWMLRMEAL